MLLGLLLLAAGDGCGETICTGQPLQLRERCGAVTVERAVTAVQPGRAGRRIFVRTADGAVFSAGIAE